MNKILKIVSIIILGAIILFGIYLLFLQPDKSSETEIIKAEEKKRVRKRPKPHQFR